MTGMRFGIGLMAALAFGVLAGCTTQEALQIEHVSNRVEQPLPARMQAKLVRMGLNTSSPIMLRVFKQEEVMEVWKANAQDRYQLVATYPICAWSGQLGPKKKEGDRQAPEGFYNVTPGQMNPNSQYYLSFDIGYPNKFDRAYGRTGRHLMVHGACSSSGCYSMSDAAMLQIYAFTRESFRGGQKSVQLQAFPFRMTAENMAKRRSSEHYEFWSNLKTGYDHFELTKRPPDVAVCGKKYAFNQIGGCSTAIPPALASAYANYSKTYEAAFAQASAQYDAKSWKDTPEFERKALARHAKRMGKKPKVSNDADYVLVDPTAKLTPTSDTVTSYSAAYARVEARKNGTEKEVIWLSVAEVEARKKAEEAKRKEVERLEKRLAAAKIPVPEANPAKPVVQQEVVSAEREGDLPIWKLFGRKAEDKPQTVTVEQPVTVPQQKQALTATVETDTAETDKAEAGPGDQKPAATQQAQTVVRPAEEKPFWKIW